MNQIWERFLLSEGAVFDSAKDIDFPAKAQIAANSIFPVPDLGVLTVSGNDAAKLLQGQITCNINDITENQSSLGAMCNPKGRVIATFLLVKTATAFLLILPLDLLEIVKRNYKCTCCDRLLL